MPSDMGRRRGVVASVQGMDGHASGLRARVPWAVRPPDARSAIVPSRPHVALYLHKQTGQPTDELAEHDTGNTVRRQLTHGHLSS